jgi:hypothetical protein
MPTQASRAASPGPGPGLGFGPGPAPCRGATPHPCEQNPRPQLDSYMADLASPAEPIKLGVRGARVARPARLGRVEREQAEGVQGAELRAPCATPVARHPVLQPHAVVIHKLSTQCGKPGKSVVSYVPSERSLGTSLAVGGLCAVQLPPCPAGFSPDPRYEVVCCGPRRTAALAGCGRSPACLPPPSGEGGGRGGGMYRPTEMLSYERHARGWGRWEGFFDAEDSREPLLPLPPNLVAPARAGALWWLEGGGLVTRGPIRGLSGLRGGPLTGDGGLGWEREPPLLRFPS